MTWVGSVLPMESVTKRCMKEGESMCTDLSVQMTSPRSPCLPARRAAYIGHCAALSPHRRVCDAAAAPSEVLCGELTQGWITTAASPPISRTHSRAQASHPVVKALCLVRSHDLWQLKPLCFAAGPLLAGHPYGQHLRRKAPLKAPVLIGLHFKATIYHKDQFQCSG